MPRAYLRLDPGFDDRKYAYPDGPYAALIATFCLAELQTQRGRFRSFDYLTRLLGKRGRHAKYLLENGDLVELPDGRVYVEGWDEWQEGDWKVTERVARIRDRQKAERDVTPDVTVPVTVDVTPDRLSGSGAVAVSGSGGSASDAPPKRTQRQVAHTWLTDHGASAPTGWANQTLNELVRVYGVKSVIETWEAAPKDVRTSNQFVRHAERLLAPAVVTRPPKYLEHNAKEVADAFDH